MDNDNNQTLSQVRPSNVVDIRTKKSLLPRQIRAAIKGQYVNSQELGHDAEQFALELERRLFADLAYEGAKVVKEVWNDTFGGNNE